MIQADILGIHKIYTKSELPNKTFNYFICINSSVTLLSVKVLQNVLNLINFY